LRGKLVGEWMYSSWRRGRLVVVKIKRLQDPRGRAYLTGLDAYRGLLHHRLRSGAKLKMATRPQQTPRFLIGWRKYPGCSRSAAWATGIEAQGIVITESMIAQHGIVATLT
jgi:hypothetical protein